jgi:hypothetical protein
MKGLGQVLSGLASLAWPVGIAFLIWWFRDQIQSLLTAFRQQIASGAAWKWKDFEFRGVDVTAFDNRGDTAYERVPADKGIFEKRHESYRLNKNLFLVHRVRPTGRLHEVTGLPTYDMSIYLVSHKNFGKMNDVKEVHYYFGQHFGIAKSEFGTKYVVKNGTDGFAVRINAYGPTLCEALIIFHDTTDTTVSRYLDFEGTGYRFQATTIETDRLKIDGRKEGQ